MSSVQLMYPTEAHFGILGYLPIMVTYFWEPTLRTVYIHRVSCSAISASNLDDLINKDALACIRAEIVEANTGG
jgi:hypothetical protein